MQMAADWPASSIHGNPGRTIRRVGCIFSMRYDRKPSEFQRGDTRYVVAMNGQIEQSMSDLFI